MNVILQTLFHEPLLTSYFLGHGHRPYDCSELNCFGCHVAEAFAEFNNDEKEEGFGALNLLLTSWQSTPVGFREVKKKCHQTFANALL